MLDSDLSVQSIRIISSAPKKIRSVWKKCRFVRTGLLSVEEAVALVDSFFIDMLPHAPTLDGFYADHANHHQLVTYEPLLCCVILTLSSRYHFFPTAGGRARSDLIHHALWEACQQLLMQLMLGQERSSRSRIRTPGSIEALLLLIEWHPQALHLPDFDDLDSDISTTSSNPEHESEPAIETRTVAKWLATIISSSRQSHRMAGMLLGCAGALANELGIFQPPADDFVGEKSSREQYLIMRRMSLAKLVYVCQQHTSARIGFTYTPSQNIPHVISMVPSSPAAGLSADDREWHTLLTARVELAQILRSVVDVVLPSSLVMSELIRSGRYVGMLDHFDALFTSWKNSHLDGQGKYLDVSVHFVLVWELILREQVSRQYFREILNAEYYTIIMGTFSLAIQAVVDRALSERPGPSRPVYLVVPPTDYRFIEAVVDCCLEIFKIVIRLAEARQLAFAPESLFVRVTMASVFLMKALGLGVKKSKLDHSLSTLAQAISGLKTNRPDDLHFGYQYVKLLDVCMANLQASFLPSMGLQPEQEQLNDCQNPLERTETCGYDSLDHDLFRFW
ncbi:unnamed protein product [Clonostachys chloroleuca]|uniref:Uncharacterized protein n=1 Tax=Clonostachys chloroleuca TaxID=1926264 RepID=A0AA35LQG6_9HYPO|nr:unnamed protein product [Clonostachys chloroleuca]